MAGAYRNFLGQAGPDQNEGLVAPEAANNAAVGGAFIPMLGIPGDAVTAVIIGALYIHGLKPGPMMMSETPHLFWFTFGIFLLIFGGMGIRLFVKMVECPKGVLIPLIVPVGLGVQSDHVRADGIRYMPSRSLPSVLWQAVLAHVGPGALLTRD